MSGLFNWNDRPVTSGQKPSELNDTFIDRVLDGYIVATLWADARPETVEHAEPGGLDATHTIHHTDVLAMRQRIREWCEANMDDVLRFIELNGDTIDLDAHQRVGFLLRLNAEGHGTGFWDQGTGYLYERLADEARAFGVFDAYVDHGVDGVVRIDNV